jgi:hypothetical protein
MDTELLVDNRVDDGQKLLTELVRNGFDVSVAFWAKTSEEGLWQLYIGSTRVQAETLGDAYRTVYTCLSRIPDPSVSLSQIKLVHATNPAAMDAIAVRDSDPGRIPIKYQGKRLGNLAIEEACIYPRDIGQMISSKVLQKILGLMNRSGSVKPSTVTLLDGTTIQAIPVGIDMELPGTIRIILHDVVTNTNRTVPADDVVNIQ